MRGAARFATPRTDRRVAPHSRAGLQRRQRFVRAAVRFAGLVESISATNGLGVSGPAPGVHARRSASALTESNWRTFPNVCPRRNVPSVDGAITLRPHRCRRPGAEDVGVIDRVATGDHRVDQCQRFASWPQSSRGLQQVDFRVDQRFETEMLSERAGQDQPQRWRRGCHHRRSLRWCRDCAKIASERCPPERPNGLVS